MSNNKTHLIAIALLSLTLIGLVPLWQASSVSLAEIKLENIPLTFGEWDAKDIPISERTYELLETKDLLMREYTNTKGEKVALAVVYSGINRGAFHPPEICYLGGGRELLNKGLEKIEMTQQGNSFSTMWVNKLIMEDRIGKEIVWYWFTVGNRVTPSYYRQQCYFIWDEIRRSSSGGTLVRVSTRVVKDDLEGAQMRGKNIIRQIAPILSNYLVPKNVSIQK